MNLDRESLDVLVGLFELLAEIDQREGEDV